MFTMGTKDTTDTWTRGGKGGWHELWEQHWHIHTGVASGELLCSAASSAGCSATTYRSGTEAQEGGYACTHAGDSLCCTSETNNIIKQLYSNLKTFHRMHYKKPFCLC